jgi:hypothetical protein
MVADHRSVLPRVPGIPWWGAVILAATASAVGFAYDAGTGEKTLSAVFSVCYVAGCVLAVLAVRQSGLFSAVIQPPLILFFAVPTAYFIFHGSNITGIKDTLINCGYPLIERFPLMFFTSVVVLLVGMGRWYLAMSSRRATSHDAETPDAATAAADSGLDSAATLAAAEKTPTRRGRRHSIERPGRGATATATEEEAPQRPARKPRTAAGSERASRSRHARPPETEIIEPVTSRPRRPRSGGPPVEPEPRRRSRASQPRERNPRDPRDPRERRIPPPVEPHDGYDRPQRSERSDQYERGERPERRRRASEYDPPEPRPNRNNGSHESGSHHPVSRVRYRSADDGESRTENRTRAPRNRNPDADSWQYDV